MRLRKRIAQLEERVAELEQRDQRTLPAPTIATVDVDAQQLWRDHVPDYASYSETDEWSGYL